METHPPDPENLRRAHDVARLADFLDAGIPVPGTPWRVGVESLLGLIPGAGDAAGLILGAVVVHQASRAGAPPALLRRMVINVAMDAALGVVPLLGDLFDFAFKSNQRNARLLLEHLGVAPPAPRARPHWLLRIALGLATFGVGWTLWHFLRAG